MERKLGRRRESKTKQKPFLISSPKMSETPSEEREKWIQEAGKLKE